MGKIRIYDKTEPEYQKLQIFANIVNNFLDNTPFNVTVENTYFDFGQDWKYTTLITHNHIKHNDTWQSVCPRDYEIIIDCDSISHMYNMAKFYAEEVQQGKYCIDLNKIA